MTLSLVSAQRGKETGTAPERPQLIADLFHAVNQPITALQCSLELSLRLPPSEEQYRDTLQGALQHAEQIARQISGIRELLQAEDPGDNLQVLPLGMFLRELVTDLEPVAESLGVRLFLQGNSPCHVLLEPHRLQQALFYLLESALCSSVAGGAVKMESSEHGKEAVIQLSSDLGRRESGATNGGPHEKARELDQRLALAIARRIVEAAGGTLQAEQTAARLHVELRLPLEAALK